MTRWQSRLRLWIFACVTGAVLTACGAADDTGDSGTSDAAGGGNDGAEGSERESPLSEYMGEGFRLGSGGMTMAVSSTDLSADDKQRMREVEDLVAACMKERGFEYVPHVPVAGDAGSPVDDAFSLEPDEFAEEYGYGISTLRFSAGDDEGDDEPSDPNQEIRNGLSEAAKKAYDKALWGDMAGADGSGAVAVAPPDEPGTTDPADQGCQQQASAEVFGSPEDRGMPDMSAFDNLFDDISALQERIDTDPRVVEAQRAWSTCMAEAGHGGFDTPADAESDVQQRMQEVLGTDRGDSAPSTQTRIGPPDTSEVDDAELQELQDYEIGLATADHECRQQDYQGVYDEVSVELQEEFVDQHRAELERYRDSMAEVRGDAEPDGDGADA